MARVGAYIDGENLVVPIQQDLDGESVAHLRSDVLSRITARHLTGLVIDLSGSSVLDTYLARKIFDTCKMAHLVGARTIVSGMSTGMAMSLIDLDFDPGDIETAVTLEEGLQRLRDRPMPEVDEDKDENLDVEDIKDKSLAKRRDELDDVDTPRGPDSD